MRQPRVPVAFNWIEYLNLAKEIATNNALGSTQESKLRCAISRAYYAAFHKALTVVYPEGPPEIAGIHGELTRELKSSDDRRRRQLGIDLDRLKGNRHRADYRSIIEGNLEALAENALIAAEEIIDRFNAL
jgi:uncharacterized protein (UPF0332 family)